MSTKPKESTKVFVAMSGGVDSSVSAMLLKEAGYDVTGVFMRCFNIDGCAKRDAEDARLVAEKLDIPFYTFDFEDEYKQEVVEYMIEGYESGITPNPDVMCNKKVKFGLFLKKAKNLGADYIATGHYARLKEEDGIYKLYAGKDDHKDQSYFLWKLTQEQLSQCMFPVGEYHKSEVRDIAEEAELPVADKPDSQGICFLGQVSLQEFLSEYISEEPGPIVDENGEKIGEHKGVWFYTIGQRSLGVDYNPNVQGRDPKPHYVAEKDVKTNTLVMAEGQENPTLFKESIELENVNFINSKFREKLKNNSQKVEVRVRYNQPLFWATIKNDDGIVIEFDEPQKFIAPGQSAVFYSGDGEMLGGGVISK